MSHEATNWAIKQRGLKPTTRIVLWHLCDRFNPDYGCFPSQARLAHDCEISRSTLNEHLGQLESAGLLRRVPRIHPVTKRQMPTRYILGFEPGFAPNDPTPCPETGHGELPFDEIAGDDGKSGDEALDLPEPCPETGHGCAARSVSDFDPDPCPENAERRVRNPDTNPVREPLSKPVKEEEDARAREAISEEFFGELLKALGLDTTALPGWWQGWPPREHVRRWRDDLGLDEDAILAVAEASRRDHPEPPDGPKALDRAMQRAAGRLKHTGAAVAKKGPTPGSSNTRRRKRDEGPRPSDDDLAAFYAAKVNSEEYLPPSMISNAMCHAMLTRGLVTVERLRARGVR
ncbi:helix-turn-helix domain-containing protein [Alkalilacustris brevis]|uniref:helix-turn-helix domain-containing protein n=1 Tax=Alkalilacustris brevis TaxID=2026338 RepID=UPI000E0DC9EB|nr:helix-turn-helix domain-containing protein [Alkalilacustris brevis]